MWNWLTPLFTHESQLGKVVENVGEGSINLMHNLPVFNSVLKIELTGKHCIIILTIQRTGSLQGWSLSFKR